jgi:hypothetical protein
MDDEGRDTRDPRDDVLTRLRARERELDEAPPLETVTWFLRAFGADAGGLEGFRDEVESTVATNPRPVVRGLKALEALLAGPPLPEGTLARLVAWEANQGLDDPSDAGARAWLEDLAALVRDALDQPEEPPQGPEPAPEQPASR